MILVKAGSHFINLYIYGSVFFASLWLFVNSSHGLININARLNITTLCFVGLETAIIRKLPLDRLSRIT